MEGINEIDCMGRGVATLDSLCLPKSVKILNCHDNKIEKITALDHLCNLAHLDLSSNRIISMFGMFCLTSLKTLNLANNLIFEVEGLANLKSLLRINLAFNQIISVVGFKAINNSSYQLHSIELQGNDINSFPNLIDSLKDCEKLKNVTLSHKHFTNPVCNIPDHRKKLFHALPNINTIDNADRDGNTVFDDFMMNLNSFELYEDSIASGTSYKSDAGPKIETPRIDAALNRYKLKSVGSSSCFSTDGTDQPSLQCCVISNMSEIFTDSTNFENSLAVKQEERLQKLEIEINHLKNVDDKGLEGNLQKCRAKRDTDMTEESDNDLSPCKSSQNKPTLKKRKPFTKSSVNTVDSDNNAEKNSLNDRKVTSHADLDKRNEAQTIYLSLISDLDSERERRWKAENAVNKLTEKIRELHCKKKEDEHINEDNTEAYKHMKIALCNMKEDNIRLNTEKIALQDEASEMKDKLNQLQKLYQNQESALNSVRDLNLKLNQEKIHLESHQDKKVHDAQAKAAAFNRELEIIRNQVANLKTEKVQLQELLISREHEHKEELSERFKMNSPEFQNHLQNEYARMEKVHLQELKQQQLQIDLLTKQYQELEDEFRDGIALEMSRYSNLHNEFCNLQDSETQSSSALKALQLKDTDKSKMITDLTALAKEQKGRITELAKIKYELQIDFKERIDKLEYQLEEARNELILFEICKKDKIKLEGEINAHISVIEGLKAERRVWSNELAQQGSNLAQDRGRLESQVKSLNDEVNWLKRNLDKETDSVNIKTKIIDDQSKTIQKIKEELLQRNDELRNARNENLTIQKDLEKQIDSFIESNQELQENHDCIIVRKEELKIENKDLKKQLEEAKEAYFNLDEQLKSKSSIIDNLGERVMKLKSGWEEKEKKYISEKNKAIEAAHIAVEKIKSFDDAFRQQLDAKDSHYQTLIKKIEAESHSEINTLNQRVLEVESEMREILSESDSKKRSMEKRFGDLAKALTQVQQGFA